MITLTQEQKDQLYEVVESESWPAVLAFCQGQIQYHESRLLTCDVSKTDRDLALMKARLDGAREVYKGFYNIKEQIGSKKKAK